MNIPPPSYDSHNFYIRLNDNHVPIGVNSTPPPYVLFSSFLDEIKSLIQNGQGREIGRYSNHHCYGDKGNGSDLKNRNLTTKEELSSQEEKFIDELLELLPLTRVSKKYKNKIINVNDQCNLVSIKEYNSYRGKIDLYFCGVESKSMSLLKAYNLIKMHIKNIEKGENTKENTPCIIRGGTVFYPAKNVIHIP